jgi:hypothetical protein
MMSNRGLSLSCFRVFVANRRWEKPVVQIESWRRESPGVFVAFVSLVFFFVIRDPWKQPLRTGVAMPLARRSKIADLSPCRAL